MKEKIPVLSICKFFLGWPLSLLALFFLGKVLFSNIQSLTITKISLPLLFLGSLCFFLYFILRALVWQKILEAQGHPMPLKRVMYLWEISEIKRYVPGNIWIVLGRTHIFSKFQVDKKITLTSLVIENQVFLLACAFVALLGLPFGIRYVFPFLHYTLSSYVILFAPLLLAFLYIYNKTLRQKFIPDKLSFLSHILPHFSSSRIIVLLCLAILYLIFFGLGTYFVISSLVVLPLHLILVLTGFFVLSLLIGYLSILTPSGLGIREGVTTLGLAPLLSLPLASLAAIYTRVILVTVEVIFLGSAYLWYKTHTKMLAHVEMFVTTHLHIVVLSLAIFLYNAYFLTASFLRYDNFYTGRFDLGNMAQTVWNTSQGRIFTLTDPNGTEIISRLAFHADFILALLAPFYFLWSDPRMLLIIQTVILSLGAVYIYLLSQKLLKDKNLSLTFSLMYLLNPAVMYTNLYDFHAVTLSTTFLLAMFYYLVSQRYLLFVLFAFLAASTKEQIWVILSLVGMCLFFLHMFFVYYAKTTKLSFRMILFSLLLTIGSFGMFYYLVSYAIPQNRGTGHFALEYYAEFGSSPTAIVKNVLFSPGKIVMTMFGQDQLMYLKQLFLPLGYLPLLAPYILSFAFPDLLIGLLSSNAQLHQIYYQYSAAITPFLFIAAMYAVWGMRHVFPVPQTFLIIYLLSCTLYSAYVFGPLPGAKSPNIDMFTKNVPDKEFIQTYVSHLPLSKSVAATNNIGSHLSHRERIYTIPNALYEAEMVVMLLNDPYAQPSLEAQRMIAEDLKTDPRYQLLIERGDFVVFQKKQGY